MKILFLTLGRIEAKGIYSCLIDEMKNNGDEVYVVSPIERKYNQNTAFEKKGGINILRVKTGNIQKVNKIEKGISTVMLEKQLIKAIDKYMANIDFDIVIYSTPPITFSKVISYVKKKCNAKSYLMLKDIFPQNAIDLSMIKNNGIIYKYFRKKEINLYKQSDYIGCMSQANADFLLKHNEYLDKDKVEILPNSIKPIDIKELSKNEINNIRQKYNIPTDKTVFVYGGNLGKPQGIDFIIDCVRKNENRNDSYFLIIGSGTDYNKLANYIKENNLKNTGIYSYMPKEDYDNVVKACDVGLVFLDNRFTIPNIPSRILTYMEYSMPIIAATDKNTDLGLILQTGQFGLWSESTDVEKFFNNVDEICGNKVLSKNMGTNGRKYLEKNYTSNISYKIIMNHFHDNEKENNKEIVK